MNDEFNGSVQFLKNSKFGRITCDSSIANNVLFRICKKRKYRLFKYHKYLYKQIISSLWRNSKRNKWLDRESTKGYKYYIKSYLPFIEMVSLSRIYFYLEIIRRLIKKFSKDVLTQKIIPFMFT